MTTKQWRWADEAQTMATDGEGTFAPVGSAELNAFLAGVPNPAFGSEPNADEYLVEPGTIEPWRRWASVAQAQAELTQQNEAGAEALRVAVAGTSSGSKLATYQAKYETALAALADDGDALAALTPEATARGETPQQLAALVKALGDAWRAAGLSIDAAYQGHKAAITALDTLEAAEAFTWSWPSFGG